MTGFDVFGLDILGIPRAIFCDITEMTVYWNMVHIAC